MAYTDLRHYLDDLGDDLLTVRDELNPRFEMAAVLRELGSRDPAVLFNGVRGYPDVRVCGNLIGRRDRIAKALDTDADNLNQTYLQRKEQSIAPIQYQGAAPVKEVVHEKPRDLLSVLPVLTHYEKDAAPFITSGVVFATDPETGRRAMGIHRMMVHGGNRLGIFLANPPLSLFHAKAEAREKPLEVAIVLGLEPATLVASVVKTGPQGPDKVHIAGALRNAPVELVRGESVAVEFPAHAEAVIEGRVLPVVRETEGPFGENAGYYFSNVSPVVEVSAITHRKNFIYPGLCPWTADVDTLLSLAGGTELLWQLQHHVNGVIDLEMIGGTIGFNAVIATNGCSPGQVRRIIQLALALDSRLKMVTVVDDDVDIRDPREVSWAVATRYQPDRDTVVIENTEAYVIDPSAVASGRGSKIGFDATRGKGPEFEKVNVPSAAVEKARSLLSEILS